MVSDGQSLLGGLALKTENDCEVWCKAFIRNRWIIHVSWLSGSIKKTVKHGLSIAFNTLLSENTLLYSFKESTQIYLTEYTW